MRLLDRYLLRELIVPFLYCLCGFLIFWNTWRLIDELRSFQRQRLTALDIAEYYLVRTPEFLVVVIPIALLLALLYALTQHARNHELTAIRAAGVSLLRLSVPYLAVGLFLSVTVGVLNELCVPTSSEAADEIKGRYLAHKNTPKESVREFKFMNFRDKRQWYIQAYNRSTDEMFRPLVFAPRAGGGRYEVSAERAAFHDGIWYFTNAQELVYSPTPGVDPIRVQSQVRPMKEFTETPLFIRGQIKIGKMDTFREASKSQLSIREIQEYQRWNPGDPRSPMFDTLLHGRIATPWTSLVVVLIALPFGVSTGRRNVFVGVASSITICFAYFILQQLCLALGSGGHLPPPLAAWLPNLVFAATGIILTWRAR